MQRRCQGETMRLESHPGHQVAFGPNGQRLAVCGPDGTVRLLRTDDWQEERSLRGHGTRSVVSRSAATAGGS